LEVARGLTLLSEDFLGARRLLNTALDADIRLADLTAAGAYCFGVTVELSATVTTPIRTPGAPPSTKPASTASATTSATTHAPSSPAWPGSGTATAAPGLSAEAASCPPACYSTQLHSVSASPPISLPKADDGNAGSAAFADRCSRQVGV